LRRRRRRGIRRSCDRGSGRERTSRNDLLWSGKGGGIPAPADGLNQLHARHNLLNAQIHRDLLVAEQRGLRGNHVEIRIDAEAVAVCGEVQTSLRGLDGGVLLLDFLGKNAQGSKVVLNLLEGNQDGLAIVGNGLIVLRAELFDGSATESTIVDGFRGRGTSRPKA